MSKEKELRPYKTDKLSKVPSWVKILFLKFWAAAAAFYFVGIGGTFIPAGDNFKFTIFFGLVIGLVMEYVVKQIVRLMKNSADNTFKYNLINMPGTKSFVLNLLYGILIVEPIIYLGGFMVKNNLWFNFFGDEAVGAEPFLIGFLYIVIDSIVVTIKNLFVMRSNKKKMKKIEE